MPIIVKILQQDNNMPWGWMSLMCIECPGQYFRSDASGNYIIFSGKGLPADVQQISAFLNQNPLVSGQIGLVVESATHIDSLPMDAKPLFETIFNESIQKIENMGQGENLNDVMLAQDMIKIRFNYLREQFNNDIKNGKTPFDSEYLAILENTSRHLLKMSNIAKTGIGRGTAYISTVLLRDTDNKLDESTLIPQRKEGEDCQIFMLSIKQNNTISLPAINNNIKKFSDNLHRYFNILINVKTGSDNSTVTIEIPNCNVVGDMTRRVFLEQVRTALYLSTLDCSHDLKWTGSKVNILANDPDLTDDEEDLKFAKALTKIVDKHKLDPKWKAKWGLALNNGVKIPRIRMIIQPRTLFAQAEKLTEELSQNGFSVASGKTKSEEAVVQVTLRRK